MGYLFNAFISGLLFFAYLIINSWWWIFGIAFFVAMSVLENLSVEDMFMDDERDVL